MADPADIVVVTLTDFITVIPSAAATNSPETSSSVQESINSPSVKPTSPTPQPTSAISTPKPTTSILSTATPSIPPAPPAVFPKDAAGPNKVAAVAIAALVMITVIYLLALALCLYGCFRGRCPNCESYAQEIRRLQNEKGIPPIRKWDVRARERVLRAQALDDVEERKGPKAALEALEGKNEQYVKPSDVVAPAGPWNGDMRRWTECSSRVQTQSGYQYNLPPVPEEGSSTFDSPGATPASRGRTPVSRSATPMTQPDEAYLPPEHLSRPYSRDSLQIPYQGQQDEPLPDRVPGEVYYNNKRERVSHFEPYM